MNKAFKVLGKEGPKFLRQLTQNYGRNTENAARKVADFLGPDGLADVALSPYLTSSAGWAPGMALYPPEIDTSSERPGGRGIREEDYPEFLRAVKADHRRKQLEQWKPAKFGKGGAAKKVKGGLDAMSELIANAVGVREAGKLKSIAGQMDLSPKVNFPAAWAGDQRSLQSAQRNISEKETGLQSPGRRKILKQAAATAARSALPDLGTSALMNTVLKESLTPSSVIIPPESIQAAYASVFGDILEHPRVLEALREGENPVMIAQHGGGAYEDDFVSELRDILGSVQTSEMAKKFGLPEESITSYLESNKLDPQKALDNWINSGSKSERAYEGEVPFYADAEDGEMDWSALFDGKSEEWWNNLKSLEDDDEVADGVWDEIPYMIDSYFQDPYKKLMGEDNFNKLSSKHPNLQELSEISKDSISGYGLEENIVNQIIEELSKRK